MLGWLEVKIYLCVFHLILGSVTDLITKKQQKCECNKLNWEKSFSYSLNIEVKNVTICKLKVSRTVFKCMPIMGISKYRAD